MLKLYNTLSRKKEVLKPMKNKRVNLFVCGITPYDLSHLGHARTYIVFDMLVKYLRERGVNVFYLQNITDIDDKIINRAKEKKVSSRKLARDFEKEYLKDMKELKVNSVTKYARATEHIKEITSQVARLVEKGYAYQIKDGIYYDIAKFKNYGKLSHRTALQAEDAVSRIDEAKEKRNKGDFCLWKLALYRTKGSGAGFSEPSWSSPFGWGRPGWHIEDTAITEKYFGPQYDIHGGARDLIFPHHEAEISQMEAISGKSPLVRCWVHTGFLTVEGQKMSKSLGNFITIRDFLKNYSRRILRLFILKSHYRSPVDYSEKEIKQVKSQLERIDEFLDKLIGLRNQPMIGLRNQSVGMVSKTKKKFEAAMEDDFNTVKAMAVIFELINKSNSLIAQNKISQADAKNILEFLKGIDKVFDFLFVEKPKEKIPQEILESVKEREKYRKQGLWQKADEIRQKMKQMGYWIEDTKKGPKTKKL